MAKTQVGPKAHPLQTTNISRITLSIGKLDLSNYIQKLQGIPRNISGWANGYEQQFTVCYHKTDHISNTLSTLRDLDTPFAFHLEVWEFGKRIISMDGIETTIRSYGVDECTSTGRIYLFQGWGFLVK